MKSLTEFIAENLENPTVTTVQENNEQTNENQGKLVNEETNENICSSQTDTAKTE